MNYQPALFRTRQQGLSLIELMITILLSSLLLLGVLQMFSNTSDSDRANTALARLQESGRVALEIIKQDLRRTGYIGCASPTNPTIPEGHTPTRTFPADGIGKQHTATQEGPGTGSDTLVIVHGSAISAQLVDISGSTATLVSSDPNLRIGDGTGQEFVLTDCTNIYVFTATVAEPETNDVSTLAGTRTDLPHKYSLSEIKDGTGATPNGFANAAAEGTEIVRLGQVIYDVNDGALRKNGAELIANVDNFQVLYGVTDGGQTSWLNADNMNDTQRGQISRVQISLIISSPENAAIATSNQTFEIANIGSDTTLAAANDKRLRRAFTTTIDMRNRSVD